MTYIIFNYCLVLSLLFGLKAIAQQGEHLQHEDSEEFKHHSVSLMIGHTHVPKAVDEHGNTGSLIIPSWGLNYSYFFNKKWAIGWHNDMEIATYVIEQENGGSVERERPLITSIVGLFMPNEHLVIMAGVGREFETHRNFWVYRVGLEYEFEIGHHWGLAPSLFYDAKESFYDSWTLGLMVGKRF